MMQVTDDECSSFGGQPHPTLGIGQLAPIPPGGIGRWKSMPSILSGIGSLPPALNLSMMSTSSFSRTKKLTILLVDPALSVSSNI